MKKILVVDDDMMNCVIVNHALSKNYQVTTVNSGEEALSFLEKELPDLILMDIELPNMSGTEVVARIKEHERWAKIPIIFLTVDSDPETEVACLKQGADDFITKPFVPLVMNSRVSRSLELLEHRRNLEKQLEKKNKQIEEATQRTMTDALTGLHNRLYLENKLQEFIDEGSHGVLFMIDLDNFKSVNDTYGHIIGDKTLQHFAEVLKKTASENDIVCRLAGDEFITFYSDLTNKEVIISKAKSIIKLFAEKMDELGYGGIVSVSIGIMITKGEEDFQNLYNKADKALYFVKNNGKSAYHFYGEDKKGLNEDNTVVDLDNVYRMMEEGMDISKGIFRLAYDEFKKIYDFVMRGVVRKKQKAQILLFTLNVKKESYVSNIENIMYDLENLISGSLRAMDAGTKYSNSQYIVILLDTDIEDGKMVATRVIEKFYKNVQFSKSDVEVFYDIRTLEPSKNIVK